VRYYENQDQQTSESLQFRIAGKKYAGLKSDIWSSGVVLYAMVCGFLPFEDPKTSNLYKKILAGDYKIPKFLS
jgi:5'-AMP-activated protein kinase catalytic alpha subunit